MTRILSAHSAGARPRPAHRLARTAPSGRASAESARALALRDLEAPPRGVRFVRAWCACQERHARGRILGCANAMIRRSPTPHVPYIPTLFFPVVDGFRPGVRARSFSSARGARPETAVMMGAGET